MAIASIAGQACAPAGVQAGSGWLLPSLADCLFVAWILWLFVLGQGGWELLLADGDTGWHIRIGESILSSGSVPRADPYSFTKPGEPWYAWEWLAGAAYAAMFRLLGLKGVVLLAGVLIAAFGVLLLRYALWRGASLLAALPVCLVAFGASSVHFLARPHLFTWLLLVAALWLWERDRRTPDKWIWLLAPATALWANLHGGFLAWLASLGVLAAGRAAEEIAAGSPQNAWRVAKRSAWLWGLCAAASLANPYGAELHRHALAYLRADWIRNAVHEFQSPAFRTENSHHFEMLLFAGLMTAAARFARGRFATAGLIVAWAHFSLVSARHIPLFAIVAAPAVALQITRWWRRLAAASPDGSLACILDRLARDWGPGFRRMSLWPAVFVLVLVALDRPFGWPGDFPSARFPTAIAERQAALLAHSRVFAHDDWADYLLFRFHPHQRVFFDGRSDFYGRDLMRDYLTAYNGRHDWEEILDRYGCEVVFVPPDSPLASLLKPDPNWRVVEDDGQAILFLRRTAAPGGRKSGVERLMKPADFAEGTRGDHGQ